MKRLLTARQVENALNRLYRQVESHLNQEQSLAVIGIRTRGETLARRIVERLQAKRDKSIDYGVLDITFYRDDLSMRKGIPLIRATEINFDLDGKIVLLVDDVLHTGRSVRAAMDALVDFGRPKAIRLAVLIDRGGRELPIAADFVGATVKAPTNASVRLHLKENDGDEGAFLAEPNAKKKKRTKK